MNFTRLALALSRAISADRPLNIARSFEIEDALGWVGLARRRSSFTRILPAVGLFGAGAAAGAACALLLAPSSGAETRARIGGKVRDAKGRLEDGVQDAQGLLQEAGQRASAAVAERHGFGNGGAT